MLAYVLREDDPAQVSAIRDGYGYSNTHHRSQISKTAPTCCLKMSALMRPL
jgi:hypothetical protein